MSDQLARIDWQMGQTLLPEHFIAQEDALIADTRLRFGMLGLPQVGIGRLRWNDTLLAEGVLSIIGMAVVLPSGHAFDIPGNAVANALNLNVPGTTRVPVYLHLTSERVSLESAERRASEGVRSAEGESVERIVVRMALTPDQTHQKAVQTMKLAEFQKDIEGAWSLADDYVPPLLQVGTSPFLAHLLDRLKKTIELFHYRIQEEIAASFLGGEGLLSAKTCLRALYTFKRFLANISAELHCHPYDLYEELKTFYTEVCLYQNVTPGNIETPYRHDDIATSLKLVTEPLLDQIQVSRGKTPYLAFERKDGLLALGDIPKEVRIAKEVYFLLQKTRVSDVISSDGLKVAGRARLPTVHQLALQGIPLKRYERPPFQHQFGAEVEFYLMSQGDEWDQALKEGTLALFDSPALASCKCYLYWRNT